MSSDKGVSAFREITALLTDPVLLVAADARVRAANPAALRLVPELAREPPLTAVVSEDERSVRAAVRRWLSVGDPIPARLTWHGRDGARVRCRCFGHRATWLPDDPPMVQVRAIRTDHGHGFAGLRERAETLHEERLRRMRAEERQRELALAAGSAEERLDRCFRFAAALAEAGTAAEVAGLVAELAPAVLGGVAAVLVLAPPAGAPPAGRGRHGGRQPGGGQHGSGRPEPFDGHGLEVLWSPLRRRGVTRGALVVAYPPGAVPDDDRQAAVGAQIAQALDVVAAR